MTISLIIAAAATAGSPFRPLPLEGAQADPAKHAQVETTAPERASGGRAGLPYAFGQRFRTLDEYLLHLKQKAGPIDLPWWRQVGPDRFERVTGKRVPPGKREAATRAELLSRFGFER
ncbi:hypothetical protein NX02_17545 [Sphingomonas sanxanigenens DSM 19645 = NX02]|uniref:Uncharacterized protein n=1 Tax=Sphingomonas sanxanigenens DSM 19645 = NX02 TaxID=1123269 RepID=W0AFX1_9SPHN|nr:hypothetical protein NX02_17545 [Sphingomonas sanxanigenens DSM 19645 = NX02]